ncbi:MAG: rhodanese domain protein [Chthoniobacteraceae bacterium]|nr:rhodanese domain protein [Chthoniobacteraceae bacterium]
MLLQREIDNIHFHLSISVKSAVSQTFRERRQSTVATSALSHQLRHVLLTDLIALALIFVVALLIGLVRNQLSAIPLEIPYQSKQARLTTASLSLPPIGPDQPNLSRQYITQTGLSTLLQKKHALLIDARPGLFHQAGHLPGALSLPRASFRESYFSLRAQLEEASRRRTPIVVYCQNVECEDSEMVADTLRHLGLNNVLVLREGFRAWEDANLLIEPKRR